MFATMIKYGVQPRHVTKLIPVSRMTASKWLNGHGTPSRHLQPAVDLLNAALAAAIKDKALIEDGNIVSVLRSYAKKVKASRKDADTAV